LGGQLEQFFTQLLPLLDLGGQGMLYGGDGAALRRLIVHGL
jgi:hypothetical protein